MLLDVESTVMLGGALLMTILCIVALTHTNIRID